jgi:hypothetical protein
MPGRRTFGHECVLARRPDALWRRCLDGVLVFPEGAAEPQLLTSPGDAIWDLLDQPIAFGDLLGHLQRRFTGSDEEIAADTDGFLRAAEAAGVVEVVEER